MMNEKQFIDNYDYFWSNLLPLSKFFIRKINGDLTTTQIEYLDSNIKGRRRSYISELAFYLFKDAHMDGNKLELDRYSKKRIDENEKILKKRYDFYSEDEGIQFTQITRSEIIEIVELATRLQHQFNQMDTHSNVIFHPRFNGCGLVDTCYGDIISNDTLYEIKMVDRNFRLSDLKQLLVYCTLNSNSYDYVINNVCLINPRKGKSVIIDIDDLCLWVSGRPSHDILSEITNYISSGEVSK